MKNPKWHRDEIILALELYFRTEPGAMHNHNPEVIELSEILNTQFRSIDPIRKNSGIQMA